MSENSTREITPYQHKKGVFRDLALRIKLVLRLMADKRVSLLLKLIPVASLLYLIGFPDLAPGPVDDAGVLWLGMYLFVELSPPEVVEEHMSALTRMIPQNQQGVVNNPDEVIDAEFWEEV